MKHHFGNARKILDIGCGDGSLMLKINSDKKYKVTGIDLYLPNLKIARMNGAYSKIKKVDIRMIKFRNKSFAVVLASQVIEHLTKKDAVRLLGKLEKIARHKIIISTPNGYVAYDPFEVNDGNKLQKHKSGWSINELRAYGYKIYGQGSGFIYRPTGLLYKFRRFKNIFVVISYLLSPLTYFFPETSAYLIAVKKV